MMRTSDVQIARSASAVDVALAGADAAAERRIGPELRMRDFDRARTACTAAVTRAEPMALAVLDDDDLAELRGAAVASTVRCVRDAAARVIAGDRVYGVVWSRGRVRNGASWTFRSLSLVASTWSLLFLPGCVKNGVRLSHSRSACQ